MVADRLIALSSDFLNVDFMVQMDEYRNISIQSIKFKQSETALVYVSVYAIYINCDCNLSLIPTRHLIVSLSLTNIYYT